MVPQLQAFKTSHKRNEPATIDAESYEPEAGPGFRAIGCAPEQRQLRAAAIARDHQRSLWILRPEFIFRNDLQAQDPLVPLSRLVPVRHEQLHVIELEYAESVHEQPRGRSRVTG